MSTVSPCPHAVGNEFVRAFQDRRGYEALSLSQNNEARTPSPEEAGAALKDEALGGRCPLHRTNLQCWTSTACFRRLLPTEKEAYKTCILPIIYARDEWFRGGCAEGNREDANSPAKGRRTGYSGLSYLVAATRPIIASRQTEGNGGFGSTPRPQSVSTVTNTSSWRNGDESSLQRTTTEGSPSKRYTGYGHSIRQYLPATKGQLQHQRLEPNKGDRPGPETGASQFDAQRHPAHFSKQKGVSTRGPTPQELGDDDDASPLAQDGSRKTLGRVDPSDSGRPISC